jgi:hypothetical protein
MVFSFLPPTLTNLVTEDSTLFIQLLNFSISHNPEAIHFTSYSHNISLLCILIDMSDILGIVHQLELKAQNVLENGCLHLQRQ